MQQSFDELFEAAFANGVADIKFFVRRGEQVTAEELRAEAALFQTAIVEERFKDVDGVD